MTLNKVRFLGGSDLGPNCFICKSDLQTTLVGKELNSILYLFRWFKTAVIYQLLYKYIGA